MIRLVRIFFFVIIQVFFTYGLTGQTLNDKDCVNNFIDHNKIDTTQPASLDTITRFESPYLMCKTFPKVLYEMDSLKVLRINTALIDTLTPEIRKLENLEELYLVKGMVRYIPGEIGELKNLRVLYIAFGGRLKHVPSSIGKLHNLERIDFCRSQLTSMPESLKKLDNLKHLNLGEAHFTEEEKQKIKKWVPDDCEVEFDWCP